MAVPSIETKIFEAIKARVASLPMVGTGKPYDLAWTAGDGALETGAGASYKPTPSRGYLRCTWTPNATQRQFIGSKEPHRRPGVLQIDVMGTKTQGSKTAREDAGQVAQHFPADMRLRFMDVKVRVLAEPSVFTPFIDTHIQVPVSIELAYE
jgi:hypothetical protein